MRTPLLAAAFSIALPAQTSLLKNPDVQGSIRLFESWIEGQMSYRGLPGIAAGVIHDRGLVWGRGFGYADLASRTPVTTRTRFRMASHTKLFTATAILQLRDAGKLRLDDPVSRHLPWFGVKPASNDDGTITIEHLLTHSSGLPREADAPYWITFRFPSYGDIQRTIGAQQAAYPPDTRWKYSNLAFTLAGMIVEKVSGETWADYVQRHILDPLGMKDSSIDKPVDGLATGYGRRMPDGSRQKMDFMDTRGIGPAAGLTSTVEDMAKFVALQFGKGKAGGAQILAGATLREMHRVRVLENNWTRGNGLGFAVSRIKDKVYVGHGGSLAGYKTHTYFSPEDRVGVVVLTNGDDSRPAQIAEKLIQTVGAEVAKAARGPAKPKLWNPAWRRYAGLYRSIWGDTEVVELNNQLVMIDPASDDPTDQLRIEPQPSGSFKLEGPSGGASVGERVEFIEEGGRVVRLRVGQVESVRVSK